MIPIKDTYQWLIVNLLSGILTGQVGEIIDFINEWCNQVLCKSCGMKIEIHNPVHQNQVHCLTHCAFTFIIRALQVHSKWLIWCLLWVKNFDHVVCTPGCLPVRDTCKTVQDVKVQRTMHLLGGQRKPWYFIICCVTEVILYDCFHFTVAGSRSIPPKFALPLTNQTLAPGDLLTLESSVTGK